MVKTVTGEVALLDNVRPQLKKPSMYKVILVNDDYTPMNFVTFVLQRFFALSQQSAESIMWRVHLTGKGVCGIFTRDIAETKSVQINAYSRQNQHPLLCQVEPTD